MSGENSYNKKILIADDDRLVLATLSSGIKDAGFEVITASNGIDALSLCLEKNPDLAMLDIDMPGMSGLKVAENLAKKSNVAFMFLSAYGGEEFVNIAKVSGAIGFLVKPMIIEQILPEINIALERAAELKKLHVDEQKLKASLHNTQDINIAVGIIMERYHLSSDDAFEKIRAVSRSERTKIIDKAREISKAANFLNQF